MGFLDLILLAVAINVGWWFWNKSRVKRIFLVEDNPHDKLLFKVNFHIDNCVVEYFDSTEGIISEFWKRKPDAVIIDYYLAGKTTGDKLLKFCDMNRIPALLVTGHEGDILGVKKDRILIKSADKKYYKELESWVNGVIA